MAISIDWATKVINIPKADTTLVSAGPPEIRELNVDTFRLALNALQASEEGMWADTTHLHNKPVSVGGVTLARVVEIINGYTITFENGSYAVNFVGANNNISDVLNLNNVQSRSQNSAGLVDGGGGGGASASAIADAVWDEASADHTGSGTMGEDMDKIKKRSKLIPLGI